LVRRRSSNAAERRMKRLPQSQHYVQYIRFPRVTLQSILTRTGHKKQRSAPLNSRKHCLSGRRQTPSLTTLSEHWQCNRIVNATLASYHITLCVPMKTVPTLAGLEVINRPMHGMEGLIVNRHGTLRGEQRLCWTRTG